MAQKRVLAKDTFLNIGSIWVGGLLQFGSYLVFLFPVYKVWNLHYRVCFDKQTITVEMGLFSEESLES